MGVNLKKGENLAVKMKLQDRISEEKSLERGLFLPHLKNETKQERANRILAMMEESNDIIVIAISKIFSTGVNIKNLHYIVFAGGGKAKIKTLQSIGRGLRKHDTKERLTIIDLADQLKYGYQHMVKRVSFYKKERINYGIKKIEEE